MSHAVIAFYELPSCVASLIGQRESPRAVQNFDLRDPSGKRSHLRSTIGHMQESRQKLVDFMASPEYEKQSELMWLQASPLVSFLSQVTTKIHRKDGWCYLAHAGDLAAKELSEELKNLKERYGFKTLKKLVIGSELFDVLDEILPGGGFRTLYRLRLTPES